MTLLKKAILSNHSERSRFDKRIATLITKRVPVRFRLKHINMLEGYNSASNSKLKSKTSLANKFLIECPDSRTQSFHLGGGASNVTNTVIPHTIF